MTSVAKSKSRASSTATRLPRTALFLGDAVLVDPAVHAWLGADTLGAGSDVDLEILRPPDDSLTRVFEALLQVGMFSAGRAVWIKGIRAEPAEEVDALLELLDGGIPDGSVLVATAQGVDKRSRLYKWFERHRAVVDMRPQTDRNGRISAADVARLVRDRCAQHGLSSPGQAAIDEIQRRAGGDVGQLLQEVDKLCLRCEAGSTFDAAMVRAGMIDQAGAWVFDLTDAIGARSLAQAQALIDGLIEQGESPQKLIGLLSARVASLLEASRYVPLLPSGVLDKPVGVFLRSGYASLPESVRRRFPAGYPAYRIFLDASRFRFRELRRLHALLLDLDLRLKTSRVSPLTALTEFAQEACTPGAAKTLAGSGRAGHSP